MCAHSGHSLVPMDKHGLSDPFCVIYENSRQVRNKIIGTYFQSFPFSYRSYPPVNALAPVFKIPSEESDLKIRVLHEIDSLTNTVGQEQFHEINKKIQLMTSACRFKTMLIVDTS